MRQSNEPTPLSIFVTLVIAFTLMYASIQYYGPAYPVCQDSPNKPSRIDKLTARYFEVDCSDLGKPGPDGLKCPGMDGCPKLRF